MNPLILPDLDQRLEQLRAALEANKLQEAMASLESLQPPNQARAVLAGLLDADEIRPLLLHPDDSAGGLMTSEFLALRRRTTADAAIQAIRDWQPKTEALSDLFVIDSEGRLSGVVTLRELITVPPNAVMIDIMDPEPVYVTAGTDQEECAQLMSRY